MANNRSAAWHYREAEAYLSRASMLTADPAEKRLEEIQPVNPTLQAHFVEMAKAHAALAEVGAMLLRSIQSPERADLLDCVSGRAKE